MAMMAVKKSSRHYLTGNYGNYTKCWATLKRRVASRPVRLNLVKTRSGSGFLLFYSIFYSIKKPKAPKSYLILLVVILHDQVTNKVTTCFCTCQNKL